MVIGDTFEQSLDMGHSGYTLIFCVCVRLARNTTQRTRMQQLVCLRDLFGKDTDEKHTPHFGSIYNRSCAGFQEVRVHRLMSV